ncbi:LOB domain-containing protein 22-like [Nicotiana tomentosiformis]|uniref:LOB domain-containing protein 22-like n=1 Tax=Nicotiana tomentosiformis TaxID=4098 RepID=UPI00051BC674|nr:LOB domain-containing protein 22-like [Nicotiana tomentosiformis]
MNADMLMFVGACAACKHQRKKCDANCQLAPYFPSNRSEDFPNVYRLFGVNNTIKLLNSVADDQKEKTAETLIFEGKVWKENPVYGCLGIERKLRAEIEAYEKELEMVRKQISFCKEMAILQMQRQQLEEQLDRSSLALVSPFDVHYHDKKIEAIFMSDTKIFYGYKYDSTLDEVANVECNAIQDADFDHPAFVEPESGRVDEFKDCEIEAISITGEEEIADLQ